MILRSFFVLTIFVTLICGPLQAAPSISGISGFLTHGQGITISGASFGTKTNAAPIMWDNFETGSFKSQWIARLPNGSQNDSDHKMTVRQSGWRNVSGAHTRSSYHAGGGHDPKGYEAVAGRNWNESGPNVMLSFDVSPAIGPSTPLYLRYYYRHDPLWNGPFNNLKTIVFSNKNASKENAYVHPLFYGEYRNLPLSGQIGKHTAGDSNLSSCTGYNYPSDYGIHPPEPNQGWHVYEYIIFHNSNNGYLRIYADNALIYEKGLTNNCNEFSYDINSIWLGGYFRATLSPESGDADGYRYFDDVYMDRSFQRVMLANNQNYNSATIIEPLIPSAWNDSSITASVNLGRFQTGATAYLFVFDRDNNHNPTGYPVTIGGSGGWLAAPSGLRIIQ